MEETTGWIEVEYPQRIPSLFSNPIQINQNEFVIVTSKNGIYKYNVPNNKWSEKWIEFPASVKKVYNPNIACLDDINNIIYVY